MLDQEVYGFGTAYWIRTRISRHYLYGRACTCQGCNDAALRLLPGLRGILGGVGAQQLYHHPTRLLGLAVAQQQLGTHNHK
jgi:hypothetical protein